MIGPDRPPVDVPLPVHDLEVGDFCETAGPAQRLGCLLDLGDGRHIGDPDGTGRKEGNGRIHYPERFGQVEHQTVRADLFDVVGDVADPELEGGRQPTEVGLQGAAGMFGVVVPPLNAHHPTARPDGADKSHGERPRPGAGL